MILNHYNYYQFSCLITFIIITKALVIDLEKFYFYLHFTTKRKIIFFVVSTKFRTYEGAKRESNPTHIIIPFLVPNVENNLT